MKKRKSLFSLVFLLICLPLLLFAINQIIILQKKASGTLANIQIDTQSLQGNITSSLWQNLAQGGEEPNDMIGPYIKEIKELQTKLIRIDHVIDYFDVYKGPNNFDFSNLDKEVNSILKTGALPMISISYTPANMAKNNQNAGEPNNWDDWYQLVKTLAYHYSVEKNIQGIYYEVWNEPDLFGGWHYNKSPSYTDLYIQTSKAVSDGAKNSVFKIGGPATTGFYPNWVKSLFKTAADNNLKLDFISWHKYSKNIDDYNHDFEELNQLLTDYPQFFSIERIITESGPNSNPDNWYDNNLSGIHLIALATQMSGKIHKLFTFEISDGPQKRSDESSGWGLLTHHTNGSKPKPRYSAIQFLNRLQGQRLATSGDGSWVTSLSSKNNKTIQTLLVNYDSSNQHNEIIPLNYKNLSPGNYKIKTTRFLGDSSQKNIMVNSLKSYSDNIYLEPNTAVLIEITPIN